MDVQATLLYRSLRPLNFAAVLDSINALIDTPDMHLEMTKPASDGSVLFTNPQFHVTIALRSERFPITRMTGALNAPITLMKDYDFDDAIGAHRLYATVSVGDGPVQVSDEIREWMGRMGTASAARPYPVEHKLVVLNALVQHIVDHDTPECVYWNQSDMIFSPQEIMEARDMPFPLPLVVRPTPIFATSPSGHEQIGVRLDCSEMFLGRTMVAEPSNLPFGELVGISMWLVSENIRDRLSLDHGSVLETPGFPTLYLRHDAPDQDDPKGRIVLTQSEPVRASFVPKFNFASARWQTPRPSEQGHEHIPAAAYPAQAAQAPAPQHHVAASEANVVRPVDFVSSRMMQNPGYAHQAAPAAPQPVAEQVAEPEIEAEPVQIAAPQSFAVPNVLTNAAAQPAQAQYPSVETNPLTSAFSRAASHPQRNGFAAPASAAPASPMKAPAQAQQSLSQAALQAPKAEAAPKKNALSALLPMRVVSSIAAIFLVVAASLTIVPNLIGDDARVANLTAPQALKSSLSVLAGPAASKN